MRTKLLPLALFWLALLFLTPASAQQGGKRIALVIGNDSYQKIRPLQKARNDASAMARELKAAGFEVLMHHDLDYRAMIKAVETVANRITGGDQVVVFFAGHGVQIRSGSYLLPVDIDASSELEVEKTAYSLDDLMARLHESRAGFTLVMVDACRDNPIRSNGRSVGGTRGLAPVEPPKGQMVVYSASRGQQALDSMGKTDANPNGVFTREFITRMRRPGVTIEDLVREVQDSVEALARTISHEQRPAIYNEARGNFYFFGPVAAPVQAQTANRGRSREEIEDGYWDSIKSERSALAFEEYVRQYPTGRYAGQARARIAMLNASGQPAAAGNVPGSARLPPRPQLPFTLDEASWRILETSEMYRNLPPPKAVRTELAKLDQIEFTGAHSRKVSKPSETTVSLSRTSAALGPKCHADTTVRNSAGGFRLTEVSYFCGDALIGGTRSDMSPHDISIKKISGTLYPPRVGAEVSIESTETIRDPKIYFRPTTASCQMTGRRQASELDPRLTGTAWDLRCKSITTYPGTAREPKVDEFTDYLLEDLGMKASAVFPLRPKQRTFAAPKIGSREVVHRHEGENGYLRFETPRSFSWTVDQKAP